MDAPHHLAELDHLVSPEHGVPPEAKKAETEPRHDTEGCGAAMGDD